MRGSSVNSLRADQRELSAQLTRMIGSFMSGEFQSVMIWTAGVSHGVSHAKPSVGLESLELRQCPNGF